MADTKFFIGRHGAIMFKLPDGRLVKTGVRVRGNHLVFLDPTYGQWYEAPVVIESKNGDKISIEIGEKRP